MQTLTRFSLLASLIAASALPAAAVTTIFAPGVTKESGWYDTNKAFTADDYYLCWAASATNLIAWWLDGYERSGGDVSQITARTKEQIFQNFKSNWISDAGGYDGKNGINWYFTGKFSSGAAPSNLKNKDSGGYLSELEGVGGRNAWNIINQDFKYWGVQETGKVFLNDETDYFVDGGSLNTYENFSKMILEQLEQGATMLSVHRLTTGSASGHAITLWGCEYDETLGLVTKLYVTDSDDHYDGLKEYDLTANSGGIGVVMQNFWYANERYGRITSSTMMYSAYIPEPSAFGLLAGVLAFGLGVSRRRR